ncbi:OLC1v1032941C1 [Oldenlandia corymbosa var. corymbosa]|uniref:OLC1v1032941C1 n=1 Tax=Oldenlandia corymbosa var. corymbosa TaxID=529605 RepID=A0AAV1CQE2_OLDCO|nr:OLC1v1032941C1 [Oldenlandia corymbosa var. corymbosa]
MAASISASSSSSINSQYLANSVPKPFSPISRRSRYGARTTTLAMRRRSEAGHHQDYNCGSSRNMVDENMIVLRKRIHEMKMVERNYEPPSEWMDWEKSYYTRYDSMICEAVGILQLILMNTRPSLAIGMIALFSMSVPTSLFVVISQLMGFTNGILAHGIPLS